MRKTLLILVFGIFISICANAQNSKLDTLFLGDRDPVYYYWDTNWWDHYALHYSDKDEYWSSGGWQVYECKPEFGRYCYIDTSLRVIGIAVTLGFGFHKTNYCTLPDSYFINKMMPEYLRLYEVDSNSDEMHLMAEGEWTHNTPPRHVMQIGIRNDGFTQNSYRKVFEVYFNEPVTVYDSFYVGMTGFNTYYHSDFYSHSSPQEDGWANAVVAGVNYSVGDTFFFPKPNHFKMKLHYFDEDNDDYRYKVTDTNWHTFHTNSNNPYLSYSPFRNFMCIFPIIDTSRVIPCNEPRGLTLAYLEGNVATLTWEGGNNADHWELSICPDSCNAGEGTVTQWNSRLATLQGLDTAQWYTAWVRSVCDSARISDWCDSIRFYVPTNGNTEPEGIATVADRHTQLMPNPASGTVTVESAFRISEVEIYDLSGKLKVESGKQKAENGKQKTTIDISDIPAGTYIVRIKTDNGTTYKKLVVR